MNKQMGIRAKRVYYEKAEETLKEYAKKHDTLIRLLEETKNNIAECDPCDEETLKQEMNDLKAEISFIEDLISFLNTL